MPYLHYKEDVKEGSNIRGVYSSTKGVKEPFIQISESQLTDYKADPNNFTVINGALKAIEHQFSNFTKAKAIQAERKQTKQSIVGPLEVSGYVYNPDAAFQQNLSVVLGICALDPDYLCCFWCKETGTDEWKFLDHDKSMVLAVAKAFNERREQNSEALHKN